MHISRLVDGSRRVTQITEISGMEGDVVTLQDLFVAKTNALRAVDAAAPLIEPLRSTGLRPGFLAKLGANGVELPPWPGWGTHEKGRPRTSRLARACAAPGGASVGSRPVRRIDLGKFPLVRVTSVVPNGSRPTLLENGQPAPFVKTRDLGSAQAMLLAVDNFRSMTGRPLRKAKHAAEQFLIGQKRTGATGLVAFAHEALALTRPNGAKADVAGALKSAGSRPSDRNVALRRG